MNEQEWSGIASAVFDDIYNYADARPNIEKETPLWFEELSTRIALFIGNSPLQYLSHDLRFGIEQDATVVAFTDETLIAGRVVVAEVDKIPSVQILTVRAISRSALVDLRIDESTSMFRMNHDWPSSLSVYLKYEDGTELSLPLQKPGVSLVDLANFVPSLTLDLGK